MATITIPLDGGLVFAVGTSHKVLSPVFTFPSASGTGIAGIAEPSPVALPVAISSTDSGTGTESTGQIVTVSVDAGTGADVLVSLILSTVDAGAAQEAGTTTATAQSTDTGQGTGSEGSAAALLVSDSGASTEIYLTAVFLPAWDGGAGAEALQLSATVPSTDAGQEADSSGIINGLPVVFDTGTGAETAWFTVVFSTETDSSTGAEVTQLIALSQDTGVGAEAQALAAQTVSFDTALSNDSDYVPFELTGDSDIAAGADSQLSSGLLYSADVGASAEILLPLILSDDDEGHCPATSQTMISQVDDSTGSDSSTVDAVVLGTDAGQGSDTGFVSGQVQVVAGTDTGAGWDVSMLLFVQTDTGTSFEFQAVPAQPLAVEDEDFGYGLDALLAEWGVSWGAIGLDIQISAIRFSQEADDGAVLVLTAETSPD